MSVILLFFLFRVCPNVTKLIIDNSLLLSSKVLNNPALTFAFGRVQKLHILTDDIYFPSKYALIIVRRFPSLILIEIEVYSIDISVPIVDIFLGELAKLQSIIIHFGHSSLLDNPFSRKYVIEKRNQSFNLKKNNEDDVSVKIEDQTLYIRLS